MMLITPLGARSKQSKRNAECLVLRNKKAEEIQHYTKNTKQFCDVLKTMVEFLWQCTKSPLTYKIEFDSSATSDEDEHVSWWSTYYSWGGESHRSTFKWQNGNIQSWWHTISHQDQWAILNNLECWGSPTRFQGCLYCPPLQQQRCDNRCGISLLSIAGNILARVLLVHLNRDFCMRASAAFEKDEAPPTW